MTTFQRTIWTSIFHSIEDWRSPLWGVTTVSQLRYSIGPHFNADLLSFVCSTGEAHNGPFEWMECYGGYLFYWFGWHNIPPWSKCHFTTFLLKSEVRSQLVPFLCLRVNFPLAFAISPSFHSFPLRLAQQLGNVHVSLPFLLWNPSNSLIETSWNWSWMWKSLQWIYFEPSFYSLYSALRVVCGLCVLQLAIAGPFLV
jgi:hypothetical protein